MRLLLEAESAHTSLTLLKLLLYLGPEAYNGLEPYFGFGWPDEIERLVGTLVKSKV